MSVRVKNLDRIPSIPGRFWPAVVRIKLDGSAWIVLRALRKQLDDIEVLD